MKENDSSITLDEKMDTFKGYLRLSESEKRRNIAENEEFDEWFHRNRQH